RETPVFFALWVFCQSIALQAMTPRGRHMTPVPTSLYEQIGGRATVEAAVTLFYRKEAADARINRFFEGVDIAGQTGQLESFFTMVLGGPQAYTGKDMQRAHAHLVKTGLNDSHFNVVIELLGQTLGELGISHPLIVQVAAIAESTRLDVLGR